jgi:hypothetical protein
MMLTGFVAASQASFPVTVAAHDDLVVNAVRVVSGLKSGGDALRVVLDALPIPVLKRGLRIVVRAEVLDPFSNATTYPAVYDEWLSPALSGASTNFDLPLPMSLSYFLAPISMTVDVAAM